MNDNDVLPEPSRRDFLKNTSLAALMAVMGGTELRADEPAKPSAPAEPKLTEIPPPPPINCGVIGLNDWGREILRTLALLKSAPVVAICDTYAPALKRAAREAPKAQTYDEASKLLADPNVQAVIIATPTPTHREIALAALAAGKHVYCEAPLANTIDDAKAIARAARDAVKLLFQPGLQFRAHPQVAFLLPFVRSGAIGKDVMARAQWHAKNSWYRPAPTPEREQALNWRLRKATSAGLLGEQGIHQIDLVACYLQKRPVAVTGFGSLIRWTEDGRDVPDTVQAVFEFPRGVNFLYDMTLCNSYDSSYEVYVGTDAAMMVRDAKAWLFKEVDAPLLGWEVYARHDDFYKSTGIGLVANASKQTTLGGTAVTLKPYEFEPLYYALAAFTANAARQAGAVHDFYELYPDGDAKDLLESFKALRPEPAPNWQDGLTATVLAVKANEAAISKQKILYEKEWFDL
jgi:predicted dehydrogenase